MTTKIERESAKIYTFPVKARAVTGHAAEQAKQARVVMMPRVANVAFDAWYHQAAIQEEHDGKH